MRKSNSPNITASKKAVKATKSVGIVVVLQLPWFLETARRPRARDNGNDQVYSTFGAMGKKRRQPATRLRRSADPGPLNLGRFPLPRAHVTARRLQR